jgi:predicted nucleotidyltransferase
MIIFEIKMKEIDTDQIKEVVNEWAGSLPHKCRVYLFGSYHKGTTDTNSDLDIAVEFLEPYSEFLWYDFSDEWQLCLSKNIGIKVQLEIYEGNRTPNLKRYLTGASTIIYDAYESSEK